MADIVKVRSGSHHHFAASLCASVRERQQGANFLHCITEIAGAEDELQPLHQSGRINPVAIGTTWRRREQPNFFVVANGFEIAASFPPQSPPLNSALGWR